MRAFHKGFTLMELMVAVSIVAVLASIAIPSYQTYVRKGVRSTGKRLLLDAANRQERYFLDNRTYTTDLSNLGFGSASVYVDRNGNEVSATNTNRVYLIAVTAETARTPIASTYAMTATAQLGQANDSACTPLTINQASTQGPSGC